MFLDAYASQGSTLSLSQWVSESGRKMEIKPEYLNISQVFVSVSTSLSLSLCLYVSVSKCLSLCLCLRYFNYLRYSNYRVFTKKRKNRKLLEFRYYFQLYLALECSFIHPKDYFRRGTIRGNWKESYNGITCIYFMKKVWHWTKKYSVFLFSDMRWSWMLIQRVN